jgi:hypothetical protein
MTSLSPTKFLEAIWPQRLLANETLELRLFNRQDETMSREFFTSTKSLLERASKAEGCDVYFGVATRFGNSGKKRDCYRLKTLWADIDDCKIEDCDFGEVTPDFIVNSGSGVHAYWVFKTPYVVRGNDENQMRIEGINRWLAHQYNGDENCCDVSRILRVPGFLNMKNTPLKSVRAYAL